jgi:hypothetical protein
MTYFVLKEVIFVTYLSFFYFHMYSSCWVFSALQRTPSNIHFCHLGGWLLR